MDKGRALAALVDLLEIDDELARVMLGEREDLGAEEGEDVVRDDLVRLVREVRVVNAEVRVEPLDFVRDEVRWDEALFHPSEGSATAR